MRGISKTMWELEKRLERWRACVCVCVNLQLIRSTSCSQAEFISTVCSFFTGIIHSHFSSWSFTIQFNVRLLHSIFRLVLNLQLLKFELSDSVSQGLWRWLYIYYVLSGEKQDTVTGVWEERERERERERVLTAHVSLPFWLMSYTWPSVCVCVCVCIKCITSSKKNNQRMLKASENVWLNMSNILFVRCLEIWQNVFSWLACRRCWSHSLCPLRLYGKNLRAKTDQMSHIQ